MRHIFKAKGYLEKSTLDKDGAKHITFEFSVSDAVELAKLELMARDLVEHQPVLLDIRIKQSDEEQQIRTGKTAPKIRNARGTTSKDTRVF
jgi:hypothetical protein